MGGGTEPGRGVAARAIAFVFAHPDDETFATGGTIAHYAQHGVRCDLFCATNGDGGRSSAVPVSSREELGAIRNEELQAAARRLGIATVVTPGLRDGSLKDADPEPLIGEIVRFLRLTRPEVVVTFGPEGAPTAHTDHRAISRAATAAFFLAALATEWPEQLSSGVAPHQAKRLYYVAWEGTPAPTGRQGRYSVRPTARIPIVAHHQDKLEAFQLHRTQAMHREQFDALGLVPDEQYALACGVAQPEGVVEDLLAGL